MSSDKKVLGLCNLCKEYQKVARCSVVRDVKMILAMMHMPSHTVKDSVVVGINPEMMSEMKHNVCLDIANESYRLQCAPVFSDDVDLHRSLTKITKDCLHAHEKIKPRYLVPEQ